MITGLAVPAPAAVPTLRRRAVRGEIEAAIEGALDAAHRLILLLDVVDGDTDLEVEEPETGARKWCGSGAQRFDVGAVA